MRGWEGGGRGRGEGGRKGRRGEMEGEGGREKEGDNRRRWNKKWRVREGRTEMNRSV